MGGPHPPAATSSDCLDDYWEPNTFCNFQRFLGFLDGAIASWYDGNAGFLNGFAGQRFVTHKLNGLRFWADKFDVAAFTLLSEIGILGKKPIPRVDGIDVGDFGGADDTVGLQVALTAWRGSDTNGPIRQLNMEGLVIGLRVDRNRLDSQFFTSADDAQSDFASISNENFLKHG
jgi:hypothetical protein